VLALAAAKISKSPSAKIGGRRQGREAALQALYVCDLCGWALEDIPELAWSDVVLPPKSHSFARHLAEGVIREQERIDALIVKTAQNWEMKRMASIDRNILRLAAYELLYDLETPARVVINEALEIVKLFSTEESYKFVNGILDKIREERPAHGKE
jgi:transcription antitermination protein NusB